MNPIHYLDDLKEGRRFGSGRFLMDAMSIKRFAAEFDPQPFHLDEDAAKATLFQGLAASGWHTAAVTMRLFVESEFKPAGGTIGASLDELKWYQPVRADDELYLLKLRFLRYALRSPGLNKVWLSIKPSCQRAISAPIPKHLLSWMLQRLRSCWQKLGYLML